MDATEPDMVMVPVKLLVVEALTPDGMAQSESVTVDPGTPAAVLEFFEEALMERVRRDFPDAVECRSVGWKDTKVLRPEC